jgi:hydroxyacylglutathione hydrolase
MKNTPFTLHCLALGPMDNLIYLIHDHASGRAAVVDPAWDCEQIFALEQQQQVKITDILLTHSHHDHVNGVESILAKRDANVHLLKAEAQFWDHNLNKPTQHYGNDQIHLGDTAIDILHTPGHTPGSACFKLDKQLITGDTLFVFGCGRCDLSGGDPNQMYDTLKKIGHAHPADTIIHPGHHYAKQETSTLGEQQAGNPFMHFDQRKDFVQYRMHEHDRCRHTPYEAMPRD